MPSFGKRVSVLRQSWSVIERSRTYQYTRALPAPDGHGHDSGSGGQRLADADANGNLIGNSAGLSLSYNALNQTDSITSPGSSAMITGCVSSFCTSGGDWS